MYLLYALPSMLSLDFTSDFWFMSITILYLLTSCFTTRVLFPQSPTVIILYHTCSLLHINYCISTYFCMLVLTIRFFYACYDSDLSTHLCLSMHAIWHSHHHLPGSTDSSRFSCPGLGAWTEGDSSCWGPSLLLWSRQINCSSSPILAPPCWLAASPVISWAPFCTVHICTFSLYPRICA